MIRLGKGYKKIVILFLLTSLIWLFANQAMNSHSHILNDGQVIRHAHPYVPDKNSHSPFQSHKHLPAVAFFLDLITSIFIDSFGSYSPFVILLTIFCVVPLLRIIPSSQFLDGFGTSRAPPLHPVDSALILI